jgi:hypothetical protein
VSLAITAWGTYKAAQVADDQLAQSREDNEKNERAQASRISIWVEGTQPTRVVLANRSLDPAWAYMYVSTVGDLSMGRSETLGIGVLPPCTRLNMPITKFREDIQQALHPHIGGHFARNGLAFRDADGRTWLRLTSGTLQSLNESEADILHNKAALNALNEGTWSTTWATEKDVEIKTLSECGRAD